MKDHAYIQLTPRVLRMKEAHYYLGMDRNRFNAEVRPYITEIPIGSQGIAFDRVDLDRWFEQYKKRNGRPCRDIGDQIWDEKNQRGSSKGQVSGISTSASVGGEFAAALEQINLKKRNVF